MAHTCLDHFRRYLDVIYIETGISVDQQEARDTVRHCLLGAYGCLITPSQVLSQVEVFTVLSTTIRYVVFARHFKRTSAKFTRVQDILLQSVFKYFRTIFVLYGIYSLL